MAVDSQKSVPAIDNHENDTAVDDPMDVSTLSEQSYLTNTTDKKFKKVLIVGPSSASQPSLSNTWWDTYLQYVVNNSVIPQQYTWHDEAGDPETDFNNLQPMLKKYDAPQRQINMYACILPS